MASDLHLMHQVGFNSSYSRLLRVSQLTKPVLASDSKHHVHSI